MKAIVYDRTKGGWEKTKGFWMVDVPEPKLGKGDEKMVLIKPIYVGVCGSDRGIWDRSAWKNFIEGSLIEENKNYRIIGHEMFGKVIAVGKKVTEVKVGDTVSPDSHIVCGECYQCKQGNTHVCTKDKIIGFAYEGCYAEVVKLPSRILWKTNAKKIEPPIAALQDPFGNAVHACTQTELKGKTVAIFGCGAVGSLSIAVAKGMGAKKIIALDTGAAQLDLAKKMGATHTIQIKVKKSAEPWRSDPEVIAAVKKATGGMGADVTMEMAGYNSSVNNALWSTCRGGHTILFGLKSGDFVFENFEHLIRNGIQMHAVIGRRVWDTWKHTKRILEDRKSGVQAKIKKYVLKNYKGSIINFKDFDRDEFEKKMKEFPKLVFKF